MEMIVDTGFLRDKKLLKYLRENRNNKVVLHDHASIEMHKGNALKNIFSSMKIVSKFPKRVIILRSSAEIASITLDTGRLKRCMVDREQTKEFTKYCYQLKLAKAGNSKISKEILGKGAVADQHIETTMFSGVDDFRSGVKDIEKSYSTDLLNTLRSEKKLTADMKGRLMRDVMTLARANFANNSNIDSLPQHKNLTDHFIFRSSLSIYSLAILWIAERGGAGTADTVKAEKLRNDFVDSSYVTYATYFDGLLTNDKRMMRLYEFVRFILDDLSLGH